MDNFHANLAMLWRSWRAILAAVVLTISASASVEAQAVQRTGDSGNEAGKTKIITAISVAQDRLVTAVQTQAGNLRLIQWRVPDSGAIVRIGDSGDQAGGTRVIAGDLIDNGLVATAVRTNNGSLRVISWRLNADGSVTRVGDSGN